MSFPSQSSWPRNLESSITVKHRPSAFTLLYLLLIVFYTLSTQLCPLEPLEVAAAATSGYGFTWWKRAAFWPRPGDRVNSLGHFYSIYARGGVRLVLLYFHDLINARFILVCFASSLSTGYLCGPLLRMLGTMPSSILPQACLVIAMTPLFHVFY